MSAPASLWPSTGVALSTAGYLLGPRWGAAIYNTVHNYALPVTVGALGYFTKSETLMAIALIWAIHISADRSMAYGLKFSRGFKDTHPARIVKASLFKTNKAVQG